MCAETSEPVVSLAGAIAVKLGMDIRKVCLRLTALAAWLGLMALQADAARPRNVGLSEVGETRLWGSRELWKRLNEDSRLRIEQKPRVKTEEAPLPWQRLQPFYWDRLDHGRSLDELYDLWRPKRTRPRRPSLN